MNKHLYKVSLLVAVFLLAAAGTGLAQWNGVTVAWGYNEYDQCNVPEPNEGFAAVAGGANHSLGLKADGFIVAWGRNDDGQCNVPEPNEAFAAVAAGGNHSLGLKADSSIVAWGKNDWGQCNVPVPNEGFVAVAGGGEHSLGLKEDGSIVAWGYNEYGQCDVPEPNEGFAAVAGGANHSLGLKEDGSIVAWGNNTYGQCNVPEPNENFVAVAAGNFHNLGLKADGSIVAWGYNAWGQCFVPEPNENFVAVAGAYCHSLGLKEDGSILAWGDNTYDQCNVPEPNEGFVAFAAGYFHSLGHSGLIVITEPDSSTTWTHFDTDLPIEWEYFPGGSLSILLCKDSLPVYLLASSIDNEGSWIYGGPVPMSLAPGNDYSIYILDDMEYSAWSEYFTIAPSEGQQVITVTEPNASTTWTHFDTDLPVEWEYPALAGISGQGLLELPDSDFLRSGDSGETVAVLLYAAGTVVDTLTLSTSNTGSWVFDGPVPEEWEPGYEYSLYIVDDLDNYGWSDAFEIKEFVSTDPRQAVGLYEFHLYPVSPNPSWGEFAIGYSVPHASDVTIDIYDVTGRLLCRAAAGEYSEGLHQLKLSGFCPGLYFCRMRAESFSSTERFVVVR